MAFEKAAAQLVSHLSGEAVNAPAPIPEWSSKGDVAYVPRVVYTTGHLDAHDLTVDAQSRVVFVNTLFGCLATKTVTI
jgi:hypothetical protein